MLPCGLDCSFSYRFLPTEITTHMHQICNCCLVATSCPALFDPMDCSLPGSSVQGILQARILERVAMPSSRGSSQPRDQSQVSYTEGGFFTTQATREAYQGICW